MDIGVPRERRQYDSRVGLTPAGVELLTADGLDAHLPADGVAVHLVDIDAVGALTITPLNGSAPYDDLLTDGESLERDGWRFTAGTGGEVTIRLAAAT